VSISSRERSSVALTLAIRLHISEATESLRLAPQTVMRQDNRLEEMHLKLPVPNTREDKSNTGISCSLLKPEGRSPQWCFAEYPESCDKNGWLMVQMEWCKSSMAVRLELPPRSNRQQWCG
jgi:hypothetical protein